MFYNFPRVRIRHSLLLLNINLKNIKNQIYTYVYNNKYTRQASQEMHLFHRAEINDAFIPSKLELLQCEEYSIQKKAVLQKTVEIVPIYQRIPYINYFVIKWKMAAWKEAAKPLVATRRQIASLRCSKLIFNPENSRKVNSAASQIVGLQFRGYTEAYILLALAICSFLRAVFVCIASKDSQASAPWLIKLEFHSVRSKFTLNFR